jgi:hypothetical protein
MFTPGGAPGTGRNARGITSPGGAWELGMTSPAGLVPAVKETVCRSPSNFQVTVSPTRIRTFSGKKARSSTVSWPAPACAVTVRGATLACCASAILTGAELSGSAAGNNPSSRSTMEREPSCFITLPPR